MRPTRSRWPCAVVPVGRRSRATSLARPDASMLLSTRGRQYEQTRTLAAARRPTGMPEMPRGSDLLRPLGFRGRDERALDGVKRWSITISRPRDQLPALLVAGCHLIARRRRNRCVLIISRPAGAR